MPSPAGTMPRQMRAVVICSLREDQRAVWIGYPGQTDCANSRRRGLAIHRSGIRGNPPLTERRRHHDVSGAQRCDLIGITAAEKRKRARPRERTHPPSALRLRGAAVRDSRSHERHCDSEDSHGKCGWGTMAGGWTGARDDGTVVKVFSMKRADGGSLAPANRISLWRRARGPGWVATDGAAALGARLRGARSDPLQGASARGRAGERHVYGVMAYAGGSHWMS